MRTTLSIDDDIYEAVRSLARAQGRSLGSVISELVRQALAPRPQDAEEAGFPVFDVQADATPITLEMVQRSNEDSV